MNGPCVILVRHGETDFNTSGRDAEERIRGWKDIPLNAEGRKEAKRQASELKGQCCVKVYCSTLSRAKVTAQYIAKAVRAPLTTTRALMPWNLGDWAGQPVKKVIPEMKRLVTDDTEEVPGGEAFATFRKRYLTFLLKALAEAKKANDVLCLVTHSRNFQVTKAWVANGRPLSLDIDETTMNDYSKETQTGERLVVRPGSQSVKAKGSLWTPDAG